MTYRAMKAWLLILLLTFLGILAVASPAHAFDDLSIALQPWTGDFDGMVERRMVRILVPYSMTHYFLDGVNERGVEAANGLEFEQEINRREGRMTRPINVVFIPTPRSQLIPKLLSGHGDIAAGGLTITDQREAQIDFSAPMLRNIREVIITGPDSPEISSLEDLAGQRVYIQESSQTLVHLNVLNQSFTERDLEPIQIELLDEQLEPDEILEMVQAGLVPATVVKHHLADFWAQVFPDLNVHHDVVLRDGLEIGWAFRENSPLLAEVVNEFVTPRGYRTKFGNIIFRRYLQNASWVLNPSSTADRERYEQTRDLFSKYSEEYDIDPLLAAALGYQESRLDQGTRSPVGAIGVMQLMPVTGESLEVGDIHQLEPNIHAGSKYLRQLLDQFGGPGVSSLDEVFFALAAYNGGQTRIRRLRREAEAEGLDPNVWLDNVELLSARQIGRENVQYVRNIYKYYLAFRLIEQRRVERESRQN